MSEAGFDAAVEAFRDAQIAFLNGDPEPALGLMSRREDVTLANPLGPPQRGWADVATATRHAAANFHGGSIRFEEVSRYATADLGYVLELERVEVRMAPGAAMTPISLRVTMVFRREDDTWKVAHRHADPTTTAKEVTSLVEQS